MMSHGMQKIFISLGFALVVLTQVASKASTLLATFWTTETYLGPCQISMIEIF